MKRLSFSSALGIWIVITLVVFVTAPADSWIDKYGSSITAIILTGYWIYTNYVLEDGKNLNPNMY